jgi:DNA-binding NarL/FixJ family response regulator
MDLFTKREIDIIKCLVEGLSNREIAKALFLTEGTVKNYLTSIYSKVDTNDRVKAILKLQMLDLT